MWVLSLNDTPSKTLQTNLMKELSFSTLKKTNKRLVKVQSLDTNQSGQIVGRCGGGGGEYINFIDYWTRLLSVCVKTEDYFLLQLNYEFQMRSILWQTAKNIILSSN